MHDPRLGRFFATDPLESRYPWYTPYQFSGNKVIKFVELEGLEADDALQTAATITLVKPELTASYIDDMGRLVLKGMNKTPKVNPSGAAASGAGRTIGLVVSFFLMDYMSNTTGSEVPLVSTYYKYEIGTLEIVESITSSYSLAYFHINDGHTSPFVVNGVERIVNDPSQLDNAYLKGVLQRRNLGQATGMDLLYVNEAKRRFNAIPDKKIGGLDELLENDEGVTYLMYENPGHHDPSGGRLNYNPSKSVIPDNHLDLWKNSVEDPVNESTRWTKEGKGKKAVFHRFQSDNTGVWHYNGSTNGRTKSGKKREISINNIPNEVKKL